MFKDDDDRDLPMMLPAAMTREPTSRIRDAVGALGASVPRTPRPVRLIVEQLDALTGAERVSLGQVIQSFGRSSFIPVMLVPALLLVSPLSGIPLFSTVCGLCIALVAAQRVARRERLWLPGWLTRREISGALMHKGIGVLRRVADWLDRNSRPRLQFLVTPPLSVACYAVCVLAGLTVPFLELVPFSSSLLGLFVALVSVGLLVRDGVYVIAATALAGVMLSVPFFLVTQVVE